MRILPPDSPHWPALRRGVHEALDAALVCRDARAGAGALAVALVCWMRAAGRDEAAAKRLLGDAWAASGGR